jgi:hypothetical protein
VIERRWSRERVAIQRFPATLVVVVLSACSVQKAEDTQRAETSAERCEVQPPFNPNFEPELEWAWTGSTIMPDHKNVIMTPVIVDVNNDDISDVVFNAYPGSSHHHNAILRAISGDTGRDLWAVTDSSLRVMGASQIAAGDIDGDALVELCTVADGPGVVCFENTGAFKFRTSLPAAIPYYCGGPSLADLDGDGTVEIIKDNYVFSNTGALKWVGSDGAGGAYCGAVSFAADIDQDGDQEVINGRTVYRHDGSILCRNTSIGHGLSGVGNFDADPYGEIVVVWSGNVSLLDNDCRLKWTSPIPEGGTGGPPNIADFDSDGQPEIGVAGAHRYVVFETNGTLKWSSKVQDYSSHVTGSSTFDFEGDGKAEVVYADEEWLRIYDGVTGTVRFQVPHSSATGYETPVIADVDGDDNAEIIMAVNYYTRNLNGIHVFRDKKDGWVNTRRIWNQHAYSVTNVNDDGTIPAHPDTNWLTPGLNTFRSNSQGTGTTSPFAAADLVASDIATSCDRSTEALHLTAHIHNQGEAAASAGIKIAFYKGNPASGGTLLGVTTHPSKIPAGSSITAELLLHPSPREVAEVWVVADDDGSRAGREMECREDNNAASAQLNLTCMANQPPVALCRDVTVSADAFTCRATASVDAGSYDPDSQPEPLHVSESPEGPFGLGSNFVTLVASDGLESATCTGTVTVVDTTPPTPGADKGSSLWPPNHHYVTVRLGDCAADARDACSGILPVDQYGRITHVTSDEVEDGNGMGDGRTCEDMVITGSSSLQLRAERHGTGNGRVYTVHYIVTDPSGNASPGSCTVRVPHDQSGRPAEDSGPVFCVGGGCPGGLGHSPLCVP